MRTINNSAALVAGLLAAAVMAGCSQSPPSPRTVTSGQSAPSSMTNSAAPEQNAAGDIPDNQV